MLGNSSGGALSNRTQVGVRGITIDSGQTRGPARRKEAAGDGRVDRVVRDEQDALFAALSGEESVERDGEGEGPLEQPPGHASGLITVEGDAFRRDAAGRRVPPAFGDVGQGNLGDAWLLAACAAVAHVQPAMLLARVSAKGDGSFNVRLGVEDVRVTPSFPVEGYADPRPNGQKDSLWVALVEKAFAQATRGSYAELEAGNPARALEALTGRAAGRLSLGPEADLERLGRRLVAARRAGAAIVARTRHAGVDAPLVAQHNYAVLELEGQGAGQAVRLYNPWGTRQNLRPIEALIHVVPLAALRRDVEALYLG